jgi:ATP-binding cassette subfamily C protein CydC
MSMLRTGGRYAERLVSHETTFRLLASLRHWFFLRIEPLAPAVLEDYRSGDVFGRIRGDIDNLDNFYLRIFVPSIVAISATAILFWVISGYSVLFACVFLLAIVLTGVVLPGWTLREGAVPGEQLVAAQSQLRTGAIDAIQGMDELIVSGADDAYFDTLRRDSEAVIDLQDRLATTDAHGKALVVLATGLTVWLGLFILIPAVRSEQIEPADLAMLALLLIAAFEIVAPLPEAFRQYGAILASARRVFTLADTPVPLTDPDTPLPKPARLDWAFETVSFRYQSDHVNALDAVSFHLGAGERVAVVGSTGSGKSSVIQLLTKSRLPLAGQITLNNASLDHYAAEDLRAWIAVVPQKAYLFNTTVAENLRVAKPTASNAELDAVCQTAQLMPFIASLKDGLQTQTGEQSVRISKGQARRLTIARALLRDFDLLVMDEPTEGLDANTAASVMDTVMQAVGDRSLLVITHQLDGLDRFDRILVLENGRVVESGDLATLLAQQGVFSRLYANKVFGS